MTTTAKTMSALLIAALLSAVLFLSPVGISSAQDAEADDTDQTEQTDRPGRFGDLTEEEREALRAEREAERQAFTDDVASQLGVTSDELVDAFKTAAINRVNARVEDGELDEERAAEIIERIESAEGIPLPGGRQGHHGPRGFGGPGPDGIGGPGAAGDDTEI